MMPATSAIDVYDIDLTEFKFRRNTIDKLEEEKKPDQNEPYLSSLLLLPKEAEEALRKVFPPGSRGSIARTNNLSYERMVIYAPKSLPRKALSELLSKHGFRSEGTFEDAELWVDNAGIYKIVFIIDRDYIYIGPQDVTMTTYLLQNKRSEAPAGFWLIDRQDFKDLMSLLPNNSFSISIERVSDLDCDASLAAFVDTMENAQFSKQTLMVCKNEDAAERCLEIFRNNKMEHPMNVSGRVLIIGPFEN